MTIPPVKFRAYLVKTSTPRSWWARWKWVVAVIWFSFAAYLFFI